MTGIAVITGATSGIGAEFARQLAGTCPTLWLIGRREALLHALAEELQDRHGTQSRVMLLDLASQPVIDQLAEELRGTPELTCLVNNAGYAKDGDYHRIDWPKHNALMNVHVETTLQLTHAALGVMMEKEKGDIINVSSVASFIPTPGSPLYGPTKAFIRSFTESLAGQYQKRGIRLQALCPGYTITDFHQKLGLDPNEFYQRHGIMRSWSAEYVVRVSLRDLERGKVVSVPGWNYRLLVMLLRRLPLGLLQRIVNSADSNQRYAK